MDRLDKCFARIERELNRWWNASTDEYVDLDDEDFQISGYYELGPIGIYTAAKALYSGLAEPVAAMWWVNGMLPRDIVATRLAKFPYPRAFAADHLIQGLPRKLQWRVVRTVYFLHSFARQRAEDFA